MSAAVSRTMHARLGILRHATDCETALRCAAFAETQDSLSTGIAEGMRKLAAYHSHHAFEWAGVLQRATGGVA